jgi:hypothetical protein
MNQYGGNFVQKLASLIQASDEDNLRIVETAWPDIIEKYGADGPFAEKTEEADQHELTL